jgi:hypothetical protein
LAFWGSRNNTPIAFAREITINADSKSSAEKGKYTDGGKEMESTDQEVKAAKVYNMQYDGPTEFKAIYDIPLIAGKVDVSKSTVKFITVNYTDRTYKKKTKEMVSEEMEKALIKKGQSVYRDGDYAYIFSKATLEPSKFPTLPIKITEVTLNKDKSNVESFKFSSNDWYPPDQPLAAR